MAGGVLKEYARSLFRGSAARSGIALETVNNLQYPGYNINANPAIRRAFDNSIIKILFMEKRRMYKKLNIGILFCLSILLIINAVGCLSFRHNKLAKQELDVSAKNLNVNVRFSSTAIVYKKKDKRRNTEFRKIIIENLNKSKIFSKITDITDKQVKSNSKKSELLDFTLHYVSHQTTWNIINDALYAASAFIIPTFDGKYEFILSVKEKKNGRLVKEYKYNEFVDNWGNLFFIFALPMTSGNKVAKEIMKDMVIKFTKDYRKSH